nr:helix-turn-helix domain-containing protein [Pseudomonas sp. RW407]
MLEEFVIFQAGRFCNVAGAARLLGITRRQLEHRLKTRQPSDAGMAD